MNALIAAVIGQCIFGKKTYKNLKNKEIIWISGSTLSRSVRGLRYLG